MKQREAIPHLSLAPTIQVSDFAIKTMMQVKEAEGETVEPPHRHQYYTIIWVKQAEGQHMVDFEQFRFASNTLYFISPEQVHQVNTTGKPDGFVLLFGEDFLQRHRIGRDLLDQLELFSVCEEYLPLKIPPGEDHKLAQLAQSLLEEYHKAPTTWQGEALAAWLRLFLIDCRRIKEHNGVIAQPRNASQVRIVRGFRDLIEEHYKTWHKVHDYASALAITSNYLNEVMKTETGTSAKEYIQKRLIAEAKRQAIYTDRSSKEIAFDLGFEDPSHFSKFFKKGQGVAFSEFRKQIAEKYQ